eukprot:CAMPEP_0201477832 /NCGR_PEP_ID=MMETSP0151_2-20130828/2792_1 /ASSEMBLY_ACC=CAM_ASM_000257 /TAXON_ID=200890 /ORGANISM="Paramoeba atlantica, Strain 621/1 / CCAP 1560/9" /LENGTH=358 /DNA_ID=CAMNT_0047858689 /DNA_START=134 /DNA_END=1210 /DNA_ORIENTATION=-
MGNCAGGEQNKEEVAKHREIEQRIREQKKVLATETKILLLGAGDTGKSTLIKQIKLIYKTGFTQDERHIFRDNIATNILVWMHTLIAAVQNLGLEWESADSKSTAATIVQQIGGGSLPPLDQRFSVLTSNSELLKKLWSNPVIQNAFEQSHSFQLGESAKYFFDNLGRIGDSSYLPSDDDILFCRARTCGVVETTFQVEGQSFRVVDVGGQRSERRKWIHCFHEVTSVIFFAALSEYNLVLFEERGVNRMKESLKLFDEIVNCVWFRDTPVILFLNKSDLFREKLTTHPLKDYFPTYSGGNDFKTGCDFVQKLYLSRNQVEKRPIYPHITCCTDTKQVAQLLNAVRDIVLKSTMAVNF